ncbi:unnamed protein product, partial [Rotaria socialis]
NSVSELLGFGGGRFTAQTAFITSSYPIAVVVVDFNAHNRLDLAVINLIGQTISILLGYENGSFGQQTTQWKFSKTNDNSLGLYQLCVVYYGGRLQ